MNEPKYADLPGARIAYHDIGDGKPILLIHGFASNARVNWLNTGWVKFLNAAGFRCIAIDNRGHGQSEKFYSPDDYGPDLFANDAFDLLDHLGIKQCVVMGYSMGARISAWMCAHRPERISKAVFGGMGINMIASASNFEAVAKALEADDPDSITDAAAASFRIFADRTGGDRKALAACIRPSRQKITEEMVRSIKTPVLVAVGDIDFIGGSAEDLAAIMENGKATVLEGLDHMKSTGAKEYKAAALDFLQENSGV